MSNYEDKRRRYKNANLTDFAPSVPRFDNPTKFVYKKELIVPSSKRPRDAFRVTSAPKPPKPEIIEPPRLVEHIPSLDSWDL